MNLFSAVLTIAILYPLINTDYGRQNASQSSCRICSARSTSTGRPVDSWAWDSYPTICLCKM